MYKVNNKNYMGFMSWPYYIIDLNPKFNTKKLQVEVNFVLESPFQAQSMNTSNKS